MRAQDMRYHSFIKFEPTTWAKDAIQILKRNNIHYGIALLGDNINGFFTAYSEINSPEMKVAELCRPVTAEVSIDTPLSDFVHQLKNGVIMLHDQQNLNLGIIDFSSLIISIEELHKQQQNLIKEMDSLLKETSEELYVTDGDGITLRVSKVFESNSGIPIRDVLGKNVYELEKQGVFKPSVTRQVLQTGEKVTILQKYKNNNEVLVTGIPVTDEKGSIFRVIVKSRETVELSKIKAQIEELDELKKRHYHEFIALQNEQENADDLVAQSPSMAKVLNTARHVANVDSTVLLLGETGVGKGVLARFIHDNSPRQGAPFITINCGAIPENLLESELFGYEPGSFTGAHRQGKIGKMELANNGTLFLDEIGDLPLSLQVKLLHVIDEGFITRIGGSKEIKLNVRFLAATNQNLSSMVEKGMFRKDLFYRLNVLPLEITPLRERSEDIVLLTQKFVDKHNKKYKMKKTVSPVALNYLQNYDWPGNVRELENLIERLVIVIASDTIEPHHLPDYIKIATLSNQDTDKEYLSVTPLKKIKEDLEREILDRLYKKHKNTYKIASLLQLNQSTVVRKLKKYKIKQ